MRLSTIAPLMGLLQDMCTVGGGNFIHNKTTKLLEA